MGTTVTIEAVRAGHEAAIDRAFGWFRAVEAICTRFDQRSELWQLTRRAGEPVEVTTLLFEAIQFAVHIAEASTGAFDPTIGAAMQQRGFNREHRTGSEPPVIDVDGTPSYRDLVLDAGHRTVTLRRPLLLDLGAVAKGMAIDLAARELQPAVDFAIDAGGDLYLGGHPADGEPWTIGIRHPREAGAIIDRVVVTNQAVCTSGRYERGDHIVPGSAAATADRHAEQDVASATVVARSAMLADALSTAAFVLGPERGVAFLEEMAVDGLILGGDLSPFATRGWPRSPAESSDA
jgi:thiamine biosynthesis lipoprotein